MAHTAPEAPFTTLFKYVKAAAGMKGIAVLAGARSLGSDGAPPRVVMFPKGGPVAPTSDDNETITDVMLDIECRCWGQDHDRLWDVVRRLIDTARRYRLAGAGEQEDDDGNEGPVGIETRWGDVEFDDEPDDARDGHAATVTLTLRAGIEEVEITGDLSEGDVEAVRYQPDPDDDDAYGPTVNQTE
jgi:hypothetical protein